VTCKVHTKSGVDQACSDRHKTSKLNKCTRMCCPLGQVPCTSEAESVKDVLASKVGCAISLLAVTCTHGMKMEMEGAPGSWGTPAGFSKPKLRPTLLHAK